MSELREPRGGERVIVNAPNMWTLTPRELVCPRSKDQRVEGVRVCRGGRVGGRRREDAASLLVLRKRRAARGHFKNGGKKIQPGKKRLYPGRWVMPTRLFN